MGIYEIIVFSIVIISVVFNCEKSVDKRRYIFFAMFILFLISALRSSKYSIDTSVYQSYYDRFKVYNFKNMLELYHNKDLKDPTYHLTAWFYSRIFKDSQWWIGFLAALFCFAVGRLIYKESLVPVVSIVMLVTLGYFRFSMSGLRQSIAIAIILMSYPFLEQRKLVPFVIMVIIASLYHRTALIFLIAYPLATMKIGIKHAIAGVVTAVIFYMFRGWLLNVLNNVLGEEERFAGYLMEDANKLTMSGFIIQCFIFGFAMFYYKRMINKDNRYLVLYNLSFIGLLFQIYSSMIAEIFRISMYFSIFNIILVANVTECETKENRSKELTQIILIGVLLLYMLRGGKYNYEFYWQ